jgi:hypothetical protein
MFSHQVKEDWEKLRFRGIWHSQMNIERMKPRRDAVEVDRNKLKIEMDLLDSETSS